MASMVVGGLFNAFAFAGAGYLFNKLNHNGYKDEIKRHNLALEHLSKAKQEWYEEEVSRKNNGKVIKSTFDNIKYTVEI